MILPADASSAALLALNQADADRLSPLSAGRFAELVGRAFLALRIGEADALLIAFDQDAEYGSANFLWCRTRFSQFVYVDRVVVAPSCRGRGLGRRLYGALFEAACARGHDRVLCEVNSVPANPVSDRFHAALGFVAIGTGTPSAGRSVRYLSRALPTPRPP